MSVDRYDLEQGSDSEPAKLSLNSRGDWVSYDDYNTLESKISDLEEKITRALRELE